MAKEATERLPVDDRCKHGLTPRTCAYCLGHAPTKIAASVGLAWIGQTGFTKRFVHSQSAYKE